MVPGQKIAVGGGMRIDGVAYFFQKVNLTVDRSVGQIQGLGQLADGAARLLVEEPEEFKNAKKFSLWNQDRSVGQQHTGK
ncbi:hypothetical protein [Spirosoma utsteinense]|uniref:Uncharacterized protein n=1 Tax=Spirosoma utsteinense TaxID=2585773 RepID=A0ABR6W8M2_9BACT|nr:hypothetical protein [Spirosoma utsteinense]MBC3787238.1 hypothetical protein [Spirosoma utsteinense]MBC3792924.1 hypothetical protein [Spirosoma utsteinense]